MTTTPNTSTTHRKKPSVTVSTLARSFSSTPTSTRPLVCIIRGFEPPDSPDGDVVLQSMPADAFIIATEAGILPVSFDPWDKHTDNWADEFDDGSPPVR